VDIIKHDYEITVHLNNIKDNINYTLKHNLANKVIIVADYKDIERFRTRTAREHERYGDALEFRPISDFYIGG
jgi:hypothetical protein